MKNSWLQVVLIATLLLAVSGTVYGERYGALFDTWWLPLVHDWTQQLHEPRGSEFRRVQVPQGRSIYWKFGDGNNIRWTEIELRCDSDSRSIEIRRGTEVYSELQNEGNELFYRQAEENGYGIARYHRTGNVSSDESLVGEWERNGIPLRIVQVRMTGSIDVFILHEDVPVVDIPRGAYIIERVSEGVLKAETFDLLDPFYILFDPTDEERLWLTTEEEGPDIEPWVDYYGLDVAYLNKLDQSRIEGW